MCFELSINYRDSIVFLKVEQLDGGRYSLHKTQQLDSAPCWFPYVMKLERRADHWLYDPAWNAFMQAVVPALEHYLRQSGASGPVPIRVLKKPAGKRRPQKAPPGGAKRDKF